MPGLTSEPVTPIAETGAHRVRGRGRPDGWDVAFAAAVLAQVGAVLALRHPPTVDGPAHLAGARVLADWHLPIYRQYYTVDLFPSPNLLAGVVLAGLLRLTDPATADRLLAAGYLVAFPAGLRYAVTGVGGLTARWLAFLAFPLSCGYLFWYGFANYGYGVALALFVVGFGWRHRAAGTVGSAAILAAGLVVTYGTHLVPWALALVFIGVTSVVEASTGGGSNRRSRLLVPAVAALPSLALAVAFGLRGGAHSAPTWRPLPELVGGLISLGMPVVTFVRAEILLSSVTALVLVATGLAVLRRPDRRLRRSSTALAAAAAAATLLYLASPNQLGLEYGLINARISVFPVLFGTLWLATGTTNVRWRQAGAAWFVLAALGLAALRTPDVLRYDRQLTEYASVARTVAPGSTLVALRAGLDSPLRGPVRVANFDPLRHAASLVAATTRGVDVGHYEAQYNYFPTRFRPGSDLRRRIDPDLTGLEAVPSRVRLPGVGALGHDRIDYVLVVDPEPTSPADRLTALGPPTGFVEDYKLLYRTKPTGLVDVYVRR